MTSHHLSFYYGDLQALEDVSLEFHQNRVTALIGPSGCGKSTFLRCLNRMNDLILPARIKGDITLDGQSIYQPKSDVVSLRRRVGMVFQRPTPFPKTVFENVAYPLRINGIKERNVLDERVELCLRRTALWDEVKDRLHRSALGLSGGLQQRLCIARALAAEPEVLLMDEPASSLDPFAKKKIEGLIHQLKFDYTIIIVTQNVQEAARVSDFTALFHMGKLVEVNTTESLFTNPKRKQTEDYITGRFG